MGFRSPRLYWRIFAMLLIALIAIAGGSAGLTVLVQRTLGAPAIDWQRLAEDAATAYRDGGAAGYDAWRQEAFRIGVMPFLIDPSGDTSMPCMRGAMLSLNVTVHSAACRQLPALQTKGCAQSAACTQLWSPPAPPMPEPPCAAAGRCCGWGWSGWAGQMTRRR